MEYEDYLHCQDGPRKLKGSFGHFGIKSNHHCHGPDTDPTNSKSNILSLDGDVDADNDSDLAPTSNFHSNLTSNSNSNTNTNTEYEFKPERDFDFKFFPATITKANPHLIAHTVRRLAWSSFLGWTTLTPVRMIVKAIVEETNTRVKVEMCESLILGGVGGAGARTRVEAGMGAGAGTRAKGGGGGMSRDEDARSLEGPGQREL
ncbi:hypothetical protein GYMLUDRAFT_50247 [Collybiopsis luxurians FD-317 M1]|uniref:Uncharacterized protein n=1 Tax=Collybiopsis luxurians FD-317 M1 TaxID=944289 RepID=A0A0D0C284_9AGAR|nr:hypothetical protein GYMLUDRAFT_50247 [Collybiopsis luxurians FD-317 M1]